MTEKIVMSEGQWLTHENGDKFAKALRDIPYHGPISSSDFEMEDGSKPIPGAPIPEDVIRMGPFGYVLSVCVDGTWLDMKTFADGQPIGADHD